MHTQNLLTCAITSAWWKGTNHLTRWHAQAWPQVSHDKASMRWKEKFTAIELFLFVYLYYKNYYDDFLKLDGDIGFYFLFIFFTHMHVQIYMRLLMISCTCLVEKKIFIIFDFICNTKFSGVYSEMSFTKFQECFFG